MQSVIDNTNLLQMCKDCGAVGFLPVATYAWNQGAKTVTVTDASTLPSGDTLKKWKIKIYDFFGGQVNGTISAISGNSGAIDVSTLDPSKGLVLKVFIDTTDGINADGGAYGLMAAGSVSHWDVEKNAVATA